MRPADHARPPTFAPRAGVRFPLVLGTLLTILLSLPPGTDATDSDQNGIDDDDELALARRFCPCVQLHGPETSAHGLTTPVYPVPVEIMGLATAQPGAGLPADRLFTLWHQRPLDYPYGDHWVAATGWTPPLPESSPAHNYVALTDDPPDLRHGIAPPGMPVGPYTLRFHWEYGNPDIDEPDEWYQTWQLGNDWTRAGSEFPPTVYAHLFRCDREGCDTEPPVAATEVVIQYWFFFPFNDWVNNHEGDWEGINVCLSSAAPATAGITEVETFAHHYYIARDPVHYPSLTDHLLLVDDTHPVVFTGGHGYEEGCIGGTGYGEGSHGCYLSAGRWPAAGEGDPLGCFEPADDVVAHTAGPYVHWRDFAIEILPDPDAPNLDYDTEPFRGWLAADLRWGTLRVPSVGGDIVTDAGNWAPRGPVYSTERRWNRTARGSSASAYVTPGLPRARPYYPASGTGWVPFALFLDPFTTENAATPTNLTGWTPGTGSWQVVNGALAGSGNGEQTTTNRAAFCFVRRPLWYRLPFVELNQRLTRLACDVAAVGAVPEATQIGVAVQSGTKDSDPVRVVWWRQADDWEIRVVSTVDGGATYTVHGTASVPPLSTSWRRLEVVTLDRNQASVALHDVYIDGELVLGSVATPASGDDSRGLVADGTAHARFDRVAVSYARLEPDYRYPPFAAWTEAPAAGDTIPPGPWQLRWLAVDEKSDNGIAGQRLDYSTDGGSTWELIDELDGCDRIYNWLPPAVTQPLGALLRLRAVDLEHDARSITTGPFMLTPGNIGAPDRGYQSTADITLTICGQPAGHGGGNSGRLRITFTLPHPAPVRLLVASVHGRLVRRLVDRPHLSRGTHGICWDLRDEVGRPAPSGVYLCVLDAGQQRLVEKTQIVR